MKDITGSTYGSLTAIRPSHKGKNRLWYWVFECVCGKEHIARANTVVYSAKNSSNPEIPSCGCKELELKTKHGYRTKENTHPCYKLYRGIMSRCYNQNHPEYRWYGAKGVTIWEGWFNNPKAFVDWAINNGWNKGKHLDKDILSEKLGINPPIYSPETCQWVTAQVNVSKATNRDNYGKHPNVKLSHEEVAQILHLYFSGIQTNQSQLARDFGLKSPSSVGRLIRLEKQRLQSKV